MHYQTFKISPNFILSSLSQKKKVALSDAQEKHVDELWEQWCRTQKNPVNRELLSFVSFNGVQLIGERIACKYYVAQAADPHLKKQLQIRPIGFSSVTHCDGAILVGRRSKAVLHYPGFFEAVPSGQVTVASPKRGYINLFKAVLRELKEGAGIAKAGKIEPFALAYDPDLGSYEICIALTIQREGAKSMPSATTEYQELCWMDPKELSLALKREKWVPFSLYLLEYHHSTMTLPAFPDNMISNPFSKSSKLT